MKKPRAVSSLSVSLYLKCCFYMICYKKKKKIQNHHLNSSIWSCDWCFFFYDRQKYHMHMYLYMSYFKPNLKKDNDYHLKHHLLFTLKYCTECHMQTDGKTVVLLSVLLDILVNIELFSQSFKLQSSR